MKKIIVKNPAKLPTISWANLKKSYEPNALKEKKSRNIGGLKQSILTVGFSVPLFIWEKEKYIVDGAGRFVVLQMLEYEGYEIPDIPYIPIEAKTRLEAKRLTLLISSKYGIETHESIGEFTLDMKEIDYSFACIDGFNLDQIDWKPPQAEEIDVDKMEDEQDFKHVCPKCKFEW